MNNKRTKLFLLPALLLIFSCSTHGLSDSTTVQIKTTMGDIKIRLYDDTPTHRDNFLKLVKSGFYNGVSFHRVINNFMIQAGDPNTKSATNQKPADTLSTYTIPAELKTTHFHKRGALAAARQSNEINPFMRSSGTQFYIVQGTKYTDEELNQAEKRINNNIKQAVYTATLKITADSMRKYDLSVPEGKIQEEASLRMFKYLSSNKDYAIPPSQREIYKTSGGTPRLDKTYTVFGEVSEGMDVVDRIAASPTGQNDVPINKITILSVKIIK
jgi:peptidylprolyl isomerase